MFIPFADPAAAIAWQPPRGWLKGPYRVTASAGTSPEDMADVYRGFKRFLKRLGEDDD